MTITGLRLWFLVAPYQTLPGIYALDPLLFMVYTGGDANTVCHSEITMFTISKTPLNAPPLHAPGLETNLKVPKSLKGLHNTRVLGPQSPISLVKPPRRRYPHLQRYELWSREIYIKEPSTSSETLLELPPPRRRTTALTQYRRCQTGSQFRLVLSLMPCMHMPHSV